MDRLNSVNSSYSFKKLFSFDENIVVSPLFSRKTPNAEKVKKEVIKPIQPTIEDPFFFS